MTIIEQVPSDSNLNNPPEQLIEIPQSVIDNDPVQVHLRSRLASYNAQLEYVTFHPGDSVRDPQETDLVGVIYDNLLDPPKAREARRTNKLADAAESFNAMAKIRNGVNRELGYVDQIPLVPDVHRETVPPVELSISGEQYFVQSASTMSTQGEEYDLSTGSIVVRLVRKNEEGPKEGAIGSFNYDNSLMLIFPNTNEAKLNLASHNIDNYAYRIDDTHETADSKDDNVQYMHPEYLTKSKLNPLINHDDLPQRDLFLVQASADNVQAVSKIDKKGVTMQLQQLPLTYVSYEAHQTATQLYAARRIGGAALENV